MILSKQLFSEKYIIPKNYENRPTYKLAEELNLIEFPISGIPTLLPIGKRLVSNICAIIRSEASKADFEEYLFPLVESKSMLNNNNTLKPYNEQYFHLKIDGKETDFIMSATSEEPVLDATLRGLHSYKQLPIKIFQIAEKFRQVPRAKGIIRGRQFLSADFTTINASMEDVRKSDDAFEELINNMAKRMGITYVERNETCVDGKYVDFLVPSDDGEQLLKSSKPASSIAMYHDISIGKLLRPKYFEDVIKPAYVGTYGIGIQRCLHAIMENCRDDLGFNFPKEIRPFDISIMPLSSKYDNSAVQISTEVYRHLQSMGARFVFDDRINLNMQERAKYSDSIGVQYKIIIGPKELETKQITLKSRRLEEISIGLGSILNDKTIIELIN